MSVVSKLGYITFGVQDMDEGIDFYRRIARLDLTTRTADAAFLTGGLEHHWVRLQESSKTGAIRLAYEVADEDALVGVAKKLAERGMAYTEGGGYSEDMVARWLRFVDPGGMEIELYFSMLERGVAPFGAGVEMEKFLHGGFAVPNYDETLRFYQEVLGFRISDQIGQMVTFLRCGDGYHHSLVLIRAPQAPRFDHFCVQVASIDDVMRFRTNAVKHGAPLRNDLLRHAPSGSMGVYVEDKGRGHAIEFCVGHPKVDDATHKARVLPLVAETVDIWQAPLPTPVALDLSEGTGVVAAAQAVTAGAAADPAHA